MMKNAFYFILKALFIFEILTILFWLFYYVEKRLNKKVIVSFKIYDVTDNEQQIIIIHILPNSLRIKGNQAMKFGQKRKGFSLK